MSRLFGLLGTLVVSATLLGFERVPDDPPAEQLKALVKEYQDSLDAYHKDIQKVEGGFAIKTIALELEAKVPGIDQAKLETIAEAAKKGCPVSKALAATPITLSVKLV